INLKAIAAMAKKLL
uniref:Mastoparan-like peptide 12d n=1 Tax=Vespa magnifica TaxID=202807 RepID=MASTD_VESMG|nr:RecName: Full=Mastoparan-like peptide 12d [Vespa magnifica]